MVEAVHENWFLVSDECITTLDELESLPGGWVLHVNNQPRQMRGVMSGIMLLVCMLRSATVGPFKDDDDFKLNALKLTDVTNWN